MVEISRLVVDVSVFADYFIRVQGREQRHRVARRFLDTVSALGLVVYEPFLFDIELRAVLVRRMSPEEVSRIVSGIREFIEVIAEENLHGIAARVALSTGCRAIDAYYIATALATESLLVTNDRVMHSNALRAGIESYYLVESFSELMKRL